MDGGGVVVEVDGGGVVVEVDGGGDFCGDSESEIPSACLKSKLVSIFRCSLRWIACLNFDALFLSSVKGGPSLRQEALSISNDTSHLFLRSLVVRRR